MLGSQNLSEYIEEGRRAARDGKQSFENPYNYITETHAAYAWEEGFRAENREPD